LKGDIEEIKRGLPDADAWTMLQDLGQFREFVAAQNQQPYASFRQAFASLHLRHDQHDKDHAELRRQLTENSRRIASFEGLLQKQLQQPRQAGSLAAPLDFPRALREWAKQYDLTPQQAKSELKSWVDAVREHSTSLQERARAEFVAQHFAEAARLYDEAAAEKLSRSRELTAESKDLVSGAVADLIMPDADGQNRCRITPRE
jgi:hypothetical protein